MSNYKLMIEPIKLCAVSVCPYPSPYPTNCPTNCPISFVIFMKSSGMFHHHLFLNTHCSSATAFLAALIFLTVGAIIRFCCAPRDFLNAALNS